MKILNIRFSKLLDCYRKLKKLFLSLLSANKDLTRFK